MPARKERILMRFEPGGYLPALALYLPFSETYSGGLDHAYKLTKEELNSKLEFCTSAADTFLFQQLLWFLPLVTQLSNC